MTAERRAYWLNHKEKLQAYARAYRAQRKKDLADGKVRPYRGEDPNWRRWNDMVRRCTIPKCKAYKNYGARGIKVCKSWLNSFDQFMRDMGESPPGHHEIDRKDNNGDYIPDNCRWATHYIQSRNRRQTRMITHAGKTQCMGDWADELGMGRSVLRSRLKYGWTVAEALTIGTHRKGRGRKMYVLPEDT